MVDTWISFANAMLQRAPGDRPAGFSARDLTSHPSRRRGRGHPSDEGEGNSDNGSNSSGDGSNSNGSDSEETLNGVHGRGGPMPDDSDVTRRWRNGRDRAAIDW